jgi:pyruvate dehydrogenase E1 component
MPENSVFDEFLEGSGKREVATTMAAVRMISKLLKDKHIGDMVVPIVPDESRTFGMEALFKQAGIYATRGQLYEPVDRESLLYYKEEKNGAILEEGISEAGCMSSFIAAGTSSASLGIHSIPFFTFYSMFGFQRIGDLIWAAADARSRGFMLGGTAGRTTLAGEGLQHQDGNSHLLALPVPCLKAYDPAYAYEMAVIVQEGIRRMYKEGIDEIYYLTMMNEKYPMPAIPRRKGIKSDILKGMYRLKSTRSNKHHLHLLGSGTILNEVINAADILKKDYKVHADVWSVTSYKQLYDDAISVERQKRLRSGKNLKSHIEACVGDQEGIFVAASDYVRALPLSVSNWFPGSFTALGTDGFGLSEDRSHLREHFEVNARHIVWSALLRLSETERIEQKTLKKGAENLGIPKEQDASFNCEQTMKRK